MDIGTEETCRIIHAFTCMILQDPTLKAIYNYILQLDLKREALKRK